MMLHFHVFLLPASLPLGCLANPLPDLFIHYYFKLLYQFLCMGVFACMPALPDVQCALGDQKRGLHPLELGLQRFVNSMWVLGIDYGSLRVLCKSSQCL